MVFRFAAALVTLAMLVASGFASYAAITMISGGSTTHTGSVGRLATPVGGDANLTAATAAPSPVGAASPATPAR